MLKDEVFDVEKLFLNAMGKEIVLFSILKNNFFKDIQSININFHI